MKEKQKQKQNTKSQLAYYCNVFTYREREHQLKQVSRIKCEESIV